MIYRKVLRHGNSLAIVLPAQVCRHLQIARGDFVLMGLTEDERLVIKKADASELAELVTKPISYEK